MSELEYVWLAQRVFEGDIVYERVFSDKTDAKEAVAEQQGGVSPEDFTWEGLNYPTDDSVVATEELEVNEKLLVKKMKVR